MSALARATAGRASFLTKQLSGVAVALGLMPVQVPEQPQRPREPYGLLHLVFLQQKSHGGAQVLVLRFETSQPLQLPASLEVGPSSFGQPEEPSRVLAPRLACLARLFQLPRGVLPDRHQHTVAGLPIPLLERYKRLVHQRGEEVKHLALPDAPSSAHLLRRLQREASCEHGKPPEQDLLLFREQIITPVHRRQERPVVGNGRPVAPREQGEGVLEPLGDLLDGERPGPGRR